MEIMSKNAIKGGEFLIRETLAQDVFIREEFSEEQNMMAEACQNFLEQEIYPNALKIDADPMLSEKYLEKAGELGLLGVSIPEEYGGLGMNFVTSLLIADIIGSAGSFSTTYGAHTGIGMLPILYYGSEEQKLKYLPKLSAGEWKACYCLTEPFAGSDANSGKTKAVLTEDGKHYKITGQKMWITNSGFADVFIVFAKIEDDKKLTAFIVEKSFNGITLNPEEHKLGIKGSSTRQVFFNDCMVPVENMLSTRENGFKIAVNILNIGRIKLAAGVLGGCKLVTTYATKYANERIQFGVPIASFGAMKHKLGEMATRIYATESADYRVGQDIDHAIESLKAQGLSDSEAKLKGLEQFAVECAIMKVHSSEVLDFVTDEGVQIYGGMGYSADAPMERAYRDARIARIYEGTNEINRLLSVDMLIKKALKGELDIVGPAMKVGQELMGPPSMEAAPAGLFGEEKLALKNMKKAILMVAGKALQDLQKQLEHEQEILMNLSDMLTEVYVAESTVLRTEKLIGLRGEAACQQQVNMTKVYFAHAVDMLERAGKTAILSFTTGDTQKVLLMGLKRFTKYNAANTKNLRRTIADSMVEGGGYIF
ncbi:MAG: acyl-CoA dehydrogenase family protein [Bacteroidia bacterium]|nr:acyl-CoA dehydrogenase family protein [Bacteroidia bacterium]